MQTRVEGNIKKILNKQNVRKQAAFIRLVQDPVVGSEHGMQGFTDWLLHRAKCKVSTAGVCVGGAARLGAIVPSVDAIPCPSGTAAKCSHRS